MPFRTHHTVLSILLISAISLMLPGCASHSSKNAASSSNAETHANTIGPGMNSNGEVTDSKSVEGGHGQKVKGLGDWEGEITGKAKSDSAFNKLQIGMPMKQVIDLIGQPTDQGAYITGKAFIPFYFGSDRHRYEMVYKGLGRLIFAGGSLGDFMSGHLIWIIHYPNEGGYR